MSICVALYHRTTYTYDRSVRMGPQLIRLRPAAHARTPILSYAVKIEPAGYFINWQQDPHGNYQARVVYPDPIESFQVEIDLVADMSVQNPFDFFLEPDAEELPFHYEPELKRELEPYLKPDVAGPFRRAVIAAGMDPNEITPHVMRHTAITNLVKAGIDLPTIQRISGHKTLSMVIRYTHVHGPHIDNAIRTIGIGLHK